MAGREEETPNTKLRLIRFQKQKVYVQKVFFYQRKGKQKI